MNKFIRWVRRCYLKFINWRLARCQKQWEKYFKNKNNVVYTGSLYSKSIFGPRYNTEMVRRFLYDEAFERPTNNRRERGDGEDGTTDKANGAEERRDTLRRRKDVDGSAGSKDDNF